MVCIACGQPLSDGARFCPFCGAAQTTVSPVRETAKPEENAAVPTPFYGDSAPVREGFPLPGFSDRVNHPEILVAVKKNRRAAKIFACFFVPLPLIGFVIYSLLSGKMELSQGAAYGGILSAVFFAFAVFSFMRERQKNSYEAVVIDKKSRRVMEQSDGDRHSTREYLIVAQTVGGKKKTIREREGSYIMAWNYLEIGDRFRYHPQFHFPYELYDKAKAPYLCCISCGTKNPVQADRCSRCHLPLLK